MISSRASLKRRRPPLSSPLPAHPADAAIIEVGLGGRLDATNVIERPAACGIAQLGIDHENFLLDPDNGAALPPLGRIAFEKAGIAKAGVPLVTMAYSRSLAARIAETSAILVHPSIPKGAMGMRPPIKANSTTVMGREDRLAPPHDVRRASGDECCAGDGDDPASDGGRRSRSRAQGRNGVGELARAVTALGTWAAHRNT